MLLISLISLLSLAIVRPAAITSSLHLIKEAQLSPSRNLSTATVDFSPSPNSSLTSIIVDPRLTYDSKFAYQVLNENSAYMNTLLALADLSTKGWTSLLRWEEPYSSSSYRDVIIRIQASQNPSTLQWRHAIWGLYLAILETSANGFRECLLTLYWRSDISGMRQKLGIVYILRGSFLGIDSDNFTEGSLEPAPPTQAISPELALANFTTILNNSTSLATKVPDLANQKIEINLLGKPLDIDAIFHTIYKGLVYLASSPQSQRISQPGLIQDHVSHTLLRWDSSYLQVQPCFEYKYAIAALARLPGYMYEQNRFEDARFIVFVDEIEVGRGWLYRRGTRGVPSSE